MTKSTNHLTTESTDHLTTESTDHLTTEIAPLSLLCISLFLSLSPQRIDASNIIKNPKLSLFLLNLQFK